MILFTEVLCDGDGRKTPKQKRKRLKTKEKITCLVAFPPPFYAMEADCFLVSENKPDLP